MAGPSKSGVAPEAPVESRVLRVPPAGLEAILDLPPAAKGVVIFAHGSGSSRHSPRNRHVAEGLREAGVGTLLFDLLTEAEAAERARVFDIELLAERLLQATRWVGEPERAGGLDVGYFGASTGAAAALVAAASAQDVAAVVSRGGRPDLAGAALAEVRAPTLLIVGGADAQVIELNRAAQARLTCENRLEIVPGAGHLFEESGTLDRVVELARAWFADHFGGTGGR